MSTRELKDALACKRITPLPWKDYTHIYNEKLKARRRVTGRPYHGGHRAETFVSLIAHASREGEPVSDDDIPGLVDLWDMQRVIALRWSSFSARKKMIDVGDESIAEEDRRLIVAAVNAASDLLRVDDLARRMSDALGHDHPLAVEYAALAAS